MPKTIIGVMGTGKLATPEDLQLAYRLGVEIAANDWVLLTGGKNLGVMDAASRGAKSQGGLTVGILSSSDLNEMSDAVDLPIVTDLGNARNNINTLSSKVIIACGMGLGTASEVALALKNNKPVVLLKQASVTCNFFSSIATERLFFADSVAAAIALTQEIVAKN